MIQRVFIDWSRPLISAVVESLIDEQPRPVDLSDLVVVVAGRRAGRRFRELLAEYTGGQHNPPRIVTISELPELLYQPKKPFASELVQRLAWIRALQSITPKQLAQVVRRLPDAEDNEGWLALADLLWRQHRELAGDGLGFADVLQRADAVDSFNEHRRWETLAAIQSAYLATLDHLGLWDKQTARRVALAQGEYVADKDIVLVGMSDLTRVQRDMLDQVAARLTVYVHAPATHAAAFDVHGCVMPETWTEIPIPIRSGQLLVADGPAEAGANVAAVLSRFAERYNADEISIGLADSGSAPVLVGRLREFGFPSHWSVGTPLTRSPPALLLEAIADYLEDDRTAQFASLARHADLGDWLTIRGLRPDWLPRLDVFIQERAPQRLQDWVEHSSATHWRAAFTAVEDLLHPLRNETQLISFWAPRVVELLRTVYAESSFDPTDPAMQSTIDGLEELQSKLEEQSGVPPELSSPVSAASAIRLVLEMLADQSAPPPAAEGAVDVMGWLDIAHDDAPATIVVGLNEGFVPQSTSADPFLPDRMRSALGVTDNARRFARDAHALLTLLHSCRDCILIANRRDARGEPLAPSRLLLATDGLQAAERIRAFYRHDQPTPAIEPPRAALSGRSGFVVPRPRPEVVAPESLHVTAFRDYIASPYRFYLKHVERLREIDDAVDELSAVAFGNLAHDVLSSFGQSEVRNSQDADQIRDYVSTELDSLARKVYGQAPIMAVAIQLEQVRTRLEAFADWQAARRSSGWSIEHTEASPEEPGVFLELPEGQSLRIVGRIDRIDRHTDGRWAILDYKTGDTGKSPDDVHRKKGEWIDLQLPLYRRLAQALGVTGNVQLGYIQLSRDTEAVKDDLAPWTADDLAAADARTVEIADCIRRRVFWSELLDEPRTLQEFGPICQDDVLNREVVV